MMTLPGIEQLGPDRRWCANVGCVEHAADGTVLVLWGGVLLASYSATETDQRDLMIALFAQRKVKIVQLAAAFDVSVSTVNRIIAKLRAGGLQAVVQEAAPREAPVRTAALWKRVRAAFVRGDGVRAAHRSVRSKASYGTVQSMYRQLQDEVAAARAVVPAQDDEVQLGLALVASNDVLPAAGSDVPSAAASGGGEPERSSSDAAPLDLAEPRSGGTSPSEAVSLEQAAAASRGQSVQHLGAWLALGMLERMGVYGAAEKWRGSSASSDALRTALDATCVALVIGEQCVEGVQRLATPTVGTLLRRPNGLAACSVRRILHAFADQSTNLFQAQVASGLLRDAVDDDERVFLYVDNHMRAYTGKETLRKGWRMQSKRAVPGTSDYYVHGVDGAPLWRQSSPAHEPIGVALQRVVDFTSLVLDDAVTPVLLFDRAGSFPATISALQDAGAEIVTYERKPYPQLALSAVDQRLEFRLLSRPKEPTLIRFTEAPQRNLRAGRGRCRRIALSMPDGKQINLLSTSPLPAETLIRRQLARWGCQENQFKHGVERWGINHLDSRRVIPFPPGTVIPNPDRAQLEYQLRIANGLEGRIRCGLARLAPGEPRHAELDAELARVLERQRRLAARRPQLPKRAPIETTTLASDLRHHDPAYKAILDTLRIALANAETDLASRLAPHSQRPREAKKLLAAVFQASGQVKVSPTHATICLAPAASRGERETLAAFLSEVNDLRLSLPGDAARRPLRFCLDVSRG